MGTLRQVIKMLELALEKSGNIDVVIKVPDSDELYPVQACYGAMYGNGDEEFPLCVIAPYDEVSQMNEMPFEKVPEPNVN